MSTTNIGNLEQKVVLCAPRWCGLNDTLVQIWFAYQYALTHGRRLMIDTRISCFWDDLDNYLVPTPTTEEGPVPIGMRVTDLDIKALNKMQTFPQRYQGRVDFMQREIHLRAAVAHKQLRLQRSIAFVTLALFARMPAQFPNGIFRRMKFLLFVGFPRGRKGSHPFSSPREHELVVHHLSGGGNESLFALTLFTLTPPLQAAVLEALNACGDDFDAIHVRNTDIQSDYEELFSNARQRLSGRRVLVCSDDSTVIAAAKEQLPDSIVFTVTTTEDSSGSPLHKLGSTRSPEQRRLLNFNMIVDLVCLSKSRELLIARPKSGQLSGYSALAQGLHRRSDVVHQLLGI
jgi:hypothetical protein